jgi:hypothetical protein
MAVSRQSILRGAILIGGILASQFILFGPALIGRKILLPLDVLALKGVYLSPSEAEDWGQPRDPILLDPVLEMEMDRRFAVSEIRAGRFPLWNPHEYCGQPFLAANQTAVLSPFRVLDYLWPGTIVLAWDQVLKALLAGIGAYLFFRIAMQMEFVPALFGGWIWPLCGYYVQWAGYPLSAAAAWLPWLFLFTDGALRDPRGLWSVGLAVVTGISLLSGHAATAAQGLLANVVFFLWRAFDFYGCKGWFSRGAAMVLAGWILGAMISAPQSLPTLDYLKTSHRMQTRLSAGSETPSAGFGALPQLVLPDFNGSTRGGAIYFGASGNELESASTGYVGLITAMVLAPLGMLNRRRRNWLIFCLMLAIIGIAQILAIPGINQLYNHFPFSALRQNRMIIATGWAILIAGVIGLQTIYEREFVWRHWFWLAAAAPAALGIWCLVRANSAPNAMREKLIYATRQVAEPVVGRFFVVCMEGFLLCLLAVAIWLAIARGLHRLRPFVFVVGLLAFVEVIFASYNVYPQSDPAKYYPPRAVFNRIAESSPGRVCGVNCFPACLTELAGLFDVRGYDASDPERLTELCYLTRPDLFANKNLAAGYLQWYYPLKFPSPITRIMNLRYLIFPGDPPAGRNPKIVEDGYWVYEDRNCLPRVFVPKTVEFVNDSASVLDRIAGPDFDPREVAYAEAEAPKTSQPADGEAKIAVESPCHVTINFDMKTPGIVVLSDTWDPGWRAGVNGIAADVLRVNYNFRGVVVPAGKGVVQYDYEPESFFRGLKLTALAAAALLGWTVFCVLKLRKKDHLTADFTDGHA